MNWLIIASFAPLLWAITNHIDKLLIERYFKAGNVFVIAIFPSMVGGFTSLIILLILREQLFISFQDACILIISGMLILGELIPYYYALTLEETSRIVPFFQLTNVFGIIFGIGLLHETYSFNQYLGAIIITISAFFISFNIRDLSKRKFSFNKKAVLLMLLCIIISSLTTFIYKSMASTHTFWQTSFWQYFGFVIFCLLMFIVPQTRVRILTALQTNKKRVLTIATFSEILNVSARFLFEYALFLAPLSLVALTNSFQPFFVFIIGVIITIFYPKIAKEDISRETLIQKTFFIALIVFGSWLIFA